MQAGGADSAGQRFPVIESMRGVAAIAVALFHFGSGLEGPVPRFANWVATGNTETGFYNLSGVNAFASQGIHGVGSYVAIANVDEWYKAAYHKNDGVTGNYYLYPTSSNVLPT